MQIKKSHTRDQPCVFVLVDHHPTAGSFGVGRRHHVDNDRAKHVDQQAGDVDGRAGHGQPKRISHFLLVNFGQRVQHPVLEFVGHVEEHDHRAAGEHHANARVHRPEDVRHSDTVGAAEHRQADQAEAGGGAEQRQRGDVEPVVVAGIGHRRRGIKTGLRPDLAVDRSLLANRHQPVTIFPPSSTMTHAICSPSRKANLDPILQRSLSPLASTAHFTPSTGTTYAALW
ncbi:hypothetical protein T01_5454 [Trichinella spiralis]|uniref:Uncharacterized protein n=1 Tax=Trichinella spiralis TaxID=6334 RepID=A0A0V1C152_TRISP|nr:hypothetical protein T01_5454 [Trichinella spiralis]